MSPPVVIESLTLRSMGESQLELSGTLQSDAAQAAVHRELERIHDRVMAAGLGSFGVDVRALRLVNSSAVRLFVDWISRAASAGYKLVFYIDKSITWHRLSFSVLQSLAPASVELVEVARGPAEELAR